MRFVMALAFMLATSPSFANESSGPLTSGPLAPGKPAGVEQANNHDLFIYISVGLIAIATGGIVYAFVHKGTSAATTTTP
jgi:hypothetical protein